MKRHKHIVDIEAPLKIFWHELRSSGIFGSVKKRLQRLHFRHFS